MRVVHSSGQDKVSKNIDQDVGFMLTNQQGAYVSFYSEPTSRYEGWYVPFGNKLYKIIENIRVVNAPRVSELRNNFWNVDRRRLHTYESFVLPNFYNSLIYELSQPAEIELTLDVRDSYDNRPFGHFYKIEQEKDVIVIRYNQESEYEMYLAIKADQSTFQQIAQWVPRTYSLDKSRNSPPYQRHVFEALKMRGRKFVFSVAQDRELAIKEARLIYSRSVVIKQLEMERIKEFPRLKNIKDPEIKLAYLCARNSLYSLNVNMEQKSGIYAGLPWFWQFWTRDEAISLKALATFARQQAREILARHFVSIGPDGRIISTQAPSADGVGWVFKRAGELVAEGEYKKDEALKIKGHLETSLAQLIKQHSSGDLASSSAKETWMDSLDRSGERIEIQALRLNMYRLSYKLFKKVRYLALENKMRNAVRAKFWDGHNLADGVGDSTIRPNIFLAAYIYPKLLKRKEWLECFDNSLVKLWLDWGGLSTVDKNNMLFCDTHTGQDTKSYHNGDSWFFLNNLTAIVLNEFDSIKFSFQINKILEASTKDILWQGIIGHHSEVSSASEQKAQGCWVQAWSAAMYIELFRKVLKV